MRYPFFKKIGKKVWQHPSLDTYIQIESVRFLMISISRLKFSIVSSNGYVYPLRDMCITVNTKNNTIVGLSSEEYALKLN